MTKQLRDQVQSPVSLEYFQERLSAGWKLKAIEWEKEDSTVPAAADAVAPEAGDEATPYGLQLEPESAHLEYNPQELGVLMAVLEMIVVEKGVSHIAEELNQRGYKTRGGAPWSSPAVFNLLPRLIDLGPHLLKSPDWQSRRNHLHTPQPS
jgi:hypothetical protein